jgi:hypothetical protein
MEVIMKVKLKKIPTKPFIITFSILNVIAGFVLGAIVTLVYIIAPPEQGSQEIGPWAILIFPILNGLLGLATGAFVTGIYNLLAKFFGGI